MRPTITSSYTMTSQNEVVVAAVSKVFANELSETGRVPETGTWSETQKSEVVALVFASFKNGECTKSSGGTDDASLMKYIPGLINNHVRKDMRLNGGVKYTPKNPGSRSGSGDESVKAMRALLAITTDEAARADRKSVV